MQAKHAFALLAVFVVGVIAAAVAMLLYLTSGGSVPGPAIEPPPVEAPPSADAEAPDWQVAPVFRLEEDVTGLHGPVGLAFLHHPGEEAKDPLYLVTEFRGTLRVVRRDRSVELFGTLPEPYLAETILPKASASYGLHGICLTPDDGILYTTSVYAQGGRGYNRITQWESAHDAAAGERPWTRGRVVRELREPFAEIPVDRGHSIGNCFIGSDGKLWVGIGDGGQASKTHDPSVAAGKLLRLELDLTAPRDNPFYDAAHPDALRSLVWTTGLRNPWAIAEGVGGRVYVADNGPAIDRLVVGERGRDYPWNGGDASLTYDALLVWPQAIGPASLLYVDRPGPFPFLERTLVLTGAGLSGVLLIPLGEDGTVSNDPAVLMKRPEPRYQFESVVGTALGPDGIYIAHMVYAEPEDGFFRPSAILKLVPGDPRGGKMARTPTDLLTTYGCLGCHALGGQGGRISPSFDGLAARIAQRLEDPAYRERLAALDSHPDPEIAALAAERRQLLEGEMHLRVMRWIELKTRHPRFEDPRAEMTLVPVPDPELQAIARYLASR